MQGRALASACRLPRLVVYVCVFQIIAAALEQHCCQIVVKVSLTDFDKSFW